MDTLPVSSMLVKWSNIVHTVDMQKPKFQYGLRYLYKHLGRVIVDVPFEITNHNRVVAVVISKEEYDQLKESHESKK